MTTQKVKLTWWIQDEEKNSNRLKVKTLKRILKEMERRSLKYYGF